MAISPRSFVPHAVGLGYFWLAFDLADHRGMSCIRARRLGRTLAGCEDAQSTGIEVFLQPTGARLSVCSGILTTGWGDRGG
jgi:hypothetical protein